MSGACGMCILTYQVKCCQNHVAGADGSVDPKSHQDGLAHKEGFPSVCYPFAACATSIPISTTTAFAGLEDAEQPFPGLLQVAEDALELAIEHVRRS